MKYILSIFLLFLAFEVSNSNIKFYNVWDYVSEDDILKARIIESECNYCSELDKTLILSSILNRCENENYPENIVEVSKAYSYKAIKTPSKVNLEFVLFFDKNDRNKNVLYFFNEKKSNPLLVKQIKSKTFLILKTKHHEYRGNRN